MDDRLDALERLARLQQNGLLDSAEVAAEKQRILSDVDDSSSSVDAPPRPRALGPFLKRHRGLAAATAAVVLLTAALVYIVLARPSSTLGEHNVAQPAQAATVAPSEVAGADLGDLFAGSPVPAPLGRGCGGSSVA